MYTGFDLVHLYPFLLERGPYFLKVEEVNSISQYFIKAGEILEIQYGVVVKLNHDLKRYNASKFSVVPHENGNIEDFL